METRKGKVGINTVLIVFIMMSFSPSLRLFGNYTAKVAKQAGWLSPFVAGAALLYLINHLYSLLVHHQGLSLMTIYEKVAGKFVAKAIAMVYLLWIMLSIGGNLRSYAARLTIGIYPNIEDKLFILVTLLIVGFFIVKAGIVIASRMSVILCGVATIGFLILSVLMLPNVQVGNLFPISYLDIMPIIKASAIIIAYWSLIVVLFISSDNFIGISDLKKRGPATTVYFIFGGMLLLIIQYGIVGSEIIPRLSSPFLLATEQIELLHSIQGFDIIIVLLWIFSDIILLSVFFFASLHLIKYIFDLESASIYSSIFTIICYFVSLLLTENYYQLTTFTYTYAMYVNIILFFIIPILMSWMYKIRTKATRALMKSKDQQ